jgi:hypothetical protein
MSKRMILSLLAVSLVGGAMVLAEPAKPTTQPAKKAKVSSPYNKLESLSEEQKTQIVDIRTEIREKIKALEAEEKSRILAVLTDEQKAELAAIQAKEEAEKKAKDAEKKKAKEEAGDDKK